VVAGCHDWEGLFMIIAGQSHTKQKAEVTDGKTSQGTLGFVIYSSGNESCCCVDVIAIISCGRFQAKLESFQGSNHSISGHLVFFMNAFE
jgi:hypothetical protein